MIHFDAPIFQVNAVQAIAFRGNPDLTAMIQKALYGTVAFERRYAFYLFGTDRIAEQTISSSADPDILVVPVKNCCTKCFRLTGGADISQFHLLLSNNLRLPPVAIRSFPLLSSAIPVTAFPPVGKFRNESLSLS